MFIVNQDGTRAINLDQVREIRPNGKYIEAVFNDGKTIDLGFYGETKNAKKAFNMLMGELGTAVNTSLLQR